VDAEETTGTSGNLVAEHVSVEDLLGRATSTIPAHRRVTARVYVAALKQ
jgi:hypothetical protein